MTDPLIIAREVLEREERLSAYSYSIPLAAQASWDADRSEQVKAAPDLARAVLRMDELADRLDHEAESRRAARQDPFEVMTIRQEAARIRAALNGENR